MKRALIILLCLTFSLAAHAGRPKLGPGFSPGIGDGVGNETGGNAGTEVTLPVGLPVIGEDPAATSDPASSNIVYTFDLNGDVNSSANQTHSALEKARDMNAAAVLIRINGFAGGWDVAENIRQELIGYDRPVMVYVNNQTVPAAQFISMGADSVYTKKGSTISNKKSNPKSKPISKSNGGDLTPSLDEHAEAVALSAGSDSYDDDVTMNEILYKAGLGNLTVVQHQPGFAERAVDFMMNPFIMLVVLLVVGFVLKKTAHAKLPGPMLYVMAVFALIYFAPFQLAGLATPGEILASIALIIAIIFSARKNKSLITAGLLVALTFTLTLVRTGDTGFLLQYTSFRELLTLPTVSMSFLILGWCIGILPISRRSEKSAENMSDLAPAA